MFVGNPIPNQWSWPSPSTTKTTETVEYNEAGQVVKRTVVTETVDRPRTYSYINQSYNGGE